MEKPKRMLIVECPFLSHIGNSYQYQEMGFDVVITSRSCEALMEHGIRGVENKHSLAGFDVILLYVAYGRTTGEEPLISEEAVRISKEIIKAAEKEKGTTIRLVGVNLYLSDELQKKQAEVFSGLFIGRNTTYQEVMEYLGLWELGLR